MPAPLSLHRTSIFFSELKNLNALAETHQDELPQEQIVNRKEVNDIVV